MIVLKKTSPFTRLASGLILMVCLILPTMMMRQTGAAISGQALLPTGRPAAFAQVRVCPYTGGGVPCSPTPAILFSDPNLTQSVPNPYTADQNGNYSVFAASGYYILQLTISGAGIYSYLISPGSGGGGGGGVTSINVMGSSPLTGAVVFACGTGLACTQSGQTITLSVATAFTIDSFTGCAGTVELGHAIVNPTFSASYSATPTNANITNTENIGSPLNLTSPFTSGTVTGTFVHSSVTTTTFTLAATLGAATPTATCTDSWQPRIFGGVGAPGATSSVTASGTTAVLSTTDVLPSIQLGAESVNQVIGPFSPNNQDIYLLLVGGSHTFVDNATGFTIPFDAPTPVTFINVNGDSIAMFLYSTTYQSGPGITVNVKVAS